MASKADAIGEPVTDLDEFWLETARGTIKESISSLEEAAKQLISAVTLVEGIYFAAVSFSDLRKVTAVQGTDAWLRVLLFVSPIVIWLICLFFAVRVFTPETYKTNLSSPELAEGVYKEMVGYKHRNLKRAYWALLAGFVTMMIAVVYYLKFLDRPGLKIFCMKIKPMMMSKHLDRSQSIMACERFKYAHFSKTFKDMLMSLNCNILGMQSNRKSSFVLHKASV